KPIDEKQIRRLGSSHYQFCDVQIIAATSRNLPKLVQDGQFREDLFCRLAVLNVELSPLRDRREDIPAIITRCLCEAAHEAAEPRNGDMIYRIDTEAVDLLCELDYPGNIRELRNLLYELTSYVSENNPISLELVHFVLHAKGGNYFSKASKRQLPFSDHHNSPRAHAQNLDQ